MTENVPGCHERALDQERVAFRHLYARDIADRQTDRQRLWRRGRRGRQCAVDNAQSLCGRQAHPRTHLCEALDELEVRLLGAGQRPYGAVAVGPPRVRVVRGLTAAEECPPRATSGEGVKGIGGGGDVEVEPGLEDLVWNIARGVRDGGLRVLWKGREGAKIDELCLAVLLRNVAHFDVVMDPAQLAEEIHALQHATHDFAYPSAVDAGILLRIDEVLVERGATVLHHDKERVRGTRVADVLTLTRADPAGAAGVQLGQRVREDFNNSEALLLSLLNFAADIESGRRLLRQVDTTRALAVVEERNDDFLATALVQCLPAVLETARAEVLGLERGRLLAETVDHRVRTGDVAAWSVCWEVPSNLGQELLPRHELLEQEAVTHHGARAQGHGSVAQRLGQGNGRRAQGAPLVVLAGAPARCHEEAAGEESSGGPGAHGGRC
mmetsp:Transcript_99910/g.322147  ORF Transcript_99910/g.322147 Transcript_99910/m.322147 type:complete len:439 (-) Transcript_99910:64-1380(-)